MDLLKYVRPLALSWLGIFCVLGIFGQRLAPFNPEHIQLRHAYETPSFAHWLGTADNGVDILSMLLHGASIAFVVGLSVVIFSLLVGTILGVFAGYLTGRIDALFMGFADLIQSFPSIVLNIAVLALVAEPGLIHVIGALCVNGWVLYARMARAQTLSLREREFVTGARALGASDLRILSRHIVPNLRGPLLIQASAGFGATILAESTLSFLGLGPGQSVSWGALLDQGSGVLLRFPHVAFIAGAMISLTVLSFNLVGDWLHDALHDGSVRL